MKRTIPLGFKSLLTVSALLAAAIQIPPAPAQAAAVTAVPASDFLDSLGVAIHLGQGQNASSVGAAMSYAGLRNARDMMNELSDVNGLLQLHSAYGIRIDAGVNGPNDAELTDQLSKARTLANAGALMAIEGPNEPNNFPVTYGGQTSSLSGSYMPVAKYQQALYTQVKADAVLKNYPVFDTSNTGAEPDNVGLQYIRIPNGAGASMPDGTVYADYANSHNYVSGSNGQLWGQTLGDNVTWNIADPALDIYNSLHLDYGVTWNKHFNGYTNAQLQTLPKVTTETGWPSTGGPGNVITAAQQGKLFMNLYLSQFKRGYKNTFIYQIKDDSEANWGFVDVNYNYKPAATYLHNLTTILNDGSGSMTPGSLGYSIAGAPATVHDLLLQKHDGTFELVVWNDHYSGSNAITVNLDAPAASARVYDPTVGATATNAYGSVSSFSLAMTDHPLVIEIPSAASGSAADTFAYASGYSSAQGTNQWYYKQWNGSAYSDMTWNGSHWQGAQTWSLIDTTTLHPDANDTALAWKAPRAGTVNISGSVHKADMSGGDGVNVKIMKNGAQVWPASGWQPIAFNDGTGYSPNLNVTVAPNDMIYFIVNKNGNNTSDATYWNPALSYSNFAYADEYASAQGTHQWYYEQLNGSTYSDMTWNGSHWQGAQPWSLIDGTTLHPDANDTALAWKAPRAGTVNISGTVHKTDMSGGDGVNVKIMKNGTQVWPASGWQPIAFNDGTGYSPNVNVSVAANDMIYFILNKNGNNASDATYWNPTISY